MSDSEAIKSDPDKELEVAIPRRKQPARASKTNTLANTGAGSINGTAMSSKRNNSQFQPKSPTAKRSTTKLNPESIQSMKSDGAARMNRIKKEKEEKRNLSTNKKSVNKPSKKTPYGLKKETPFPFWESPTPEECEKINSLLSDEHGGAIAPKTIPRPSIQIAGCGEVPCVLDALIRTLLSGATSGRNSAFAYNSLATRFGILKEGIGKGSVNWEAVRQAPVREVFETIKRGGLADVKSKNIKAILDMIHEENEQRYAALKTDQKNEDPTHPLTEEEKKDREYEIACTEQNFLSLNHLHTLPTEEVMEELTKYPGIGPKTAACVNLFCLQRPCFAVDTHIFRLCKWLGWVPADLANPANTFDHLNVRIPDHLKYSLHVLLIRHGKKCPRCRAITGESSEGWDSGCAIDEFVKRTGKRKGGLEIGSQRPKKSRDH